MEFQTGWPSNINADSKLQKKTKNVLRWEPHATDVSFRWPGMREVASACVESHAAFRVDGIHLVGQQSWHTVIFDAHY